MIATLVRPTLSMDSTAGKLSVTPPPIAKTTEEIRADIEKAVSDGRITKEQIFERLAPEQLRKLYPAENKRNDLEKQRIDFENAISAGGITKEQIFDLLSPEQLYELYPNLPVTLGNLAIGQSADAKQRIA